MLNLPCYSALRPEFFAKQRPKRYLCNATFSAILDTQFALVKIFLCIATKCISHCHK